MHIGPKHGSVLQIGIGQYTCCTGIHICGLYSSLDERDDIIFGYLQQGAIANDRQIFIHSEQTPEQFEQTLNHRCPECAAQQKSNRLDVKQAHELYFPTGTFDPWYMDDAVVGYYNYCQEDRPENLRAVAEMAWAQQAIPGVEYLFAYESRLNYFVENRSVVSLCLYNVQNISGATMMNILQTHPYTISGGIITQNPYYIVPDRWLSQNAPQFLTRSPST
jgi:hypothetical protein